MLRAGLRAELLKIRNSPGVEKGWRAESAIERGGDGVRVGFVEFAGQGLKMGRNYQWLVSQSNGNGGDLRLNSEKRVQAADHGRTHSGCPVRVFRKVDIKTSGRFTDAGDFGTGYHDERGESGFPSLANCMAQKG